MGSQVNPKELFQILMDGGETNLELEEAISNVVCKIDFINVVISHELLNLVTEWHEALTPLAKENKIELFFLRHDFLFGEAVELLFPISAIIADYAIIKYVLHDAKVISLPLINNLLLAIVASIIIIFVLKFIGQRVKVKVVTNIRRFNHLPVFYITKGDKNRLIEVKNNNKSVYKALALNALSGILSNIISLAFHFIPFINTK